VSDTTKVLPAEAEPLPVARDSQDDPATAEARALASETLEQVGERRQFERRELARDAIGKATVFSIKVLFLILIIGSLIYSWHLLAPEKWRYLSSDDLSKIQTFLSNIIVGAVLGFLAKHKFM
jgi:hypothetical protein